MSHINRDDKPFPMLYEEIFLTAIRNNTMDEKELKSYIANIVFKIKQNEIHERIRALKVPHIVTTNYESSIKGETPKSNSSLVVEKLYSVFRKHELNGTTNWHLHGDCNNPMSINLGYEHYCGELQNMRSYMISGTSYKSYGLLKEALIRDQSEKLGD